MGGRLTVVTCAVLCLSFNSIPAQAINIVIDDTYDTNGFFAAGSQARAALEVVTDFYSAILGDTFSAITVPDPFTSSLPPHLNPGTAQWIWTMSFTHPSADGQVTITNPTVAADEYRLFVGAKNLPDNVRGRGGPGGGSRQSTNDGGNFTTEEGAKIEATTQDFFAAITTRGEASGFARWGGVVMFDLDAPSWYFNPQTPPPIGTTDFYTTAIHEVGHALGLGSSDTWLALTAGSGDSAYFFGDSAVAQYGGNVPLAYNLVDGNFVVDTGHWREGVMSQVFGTSTPQEAAMDPSSISGTRKRLTALDAAALTDIGWTVVPQMSLPGDYNGDSVVDAADYTVWRDNYGSSESLLNDDSPGVDYDDYARWKTNFGSVGNQGGGSMANRLSVIPEPSPRLLAIAGVAVLLTLRRSLRRRLAGRFA